MPANEQVIEFREDGTAQAVQRDDSPILLLGPAKQERASTVEWIQDWQWWGVRIDGKFVHAHASRQHCIDWEIEYLNNRILHR